MTENPPQVYESFPLGEITSKDGERFAVRVGLDKALVGQLKAYSRDTSDSELQNNTSDYKRFGEGSYEEWYAKERTPYALIAGDGTLAALAWFGPKPLGRKSLKYLSKEELSKESSQERGDWHTIVYRSYKPFRGKGLMTPFMRFVVADYKRRHPSIKLWAGISTNNPASVALALKLGLIEDKGLADPEAHWCAMVEK